MYCGVKVHRIRPRPPNKTKQYETGPETSQTIFVNTARTNLKTATEKQKKNKRSENPDMCEQVREKFRKPGENVFYVLPPWAVGA